MKTYLSDFDKVWLSIERISGKFIISLEDDSKNYTFKYLDGKIDFASKAFINEIAGLGNTNETKFNKNLSTFNKIIE